MMSARYRDPKDVPTSALIERLRQLADAVANNNMDEFVMRIPAEVDRDADIVLSEAAKRLEAANDICVFTGKPINEVLDDIGREVAAESRQKAEDKEKTPYDFYADLFELDLLNKT